MSNRTILLLVIIAAAAWFLYEPVMDRYFTDTSLRVSEPLSPFSGDQPSSHLETKRLDVTLASYGGRILSVRLKKFVGSDGKPVELISGLLKSRGGIRIEIPGEEGLDDGLYHFSRDGHGVVFFRQAPSGLEVRKSYSPLGNSALAFRLQLVNRSGKRISLPGGYRIIPFYGIGLDGENGRKYLKVVWKEEGGDEVYREKAAKVKEPVRTEKAVAWMGLQNRYFAQVIVPLNRKLPASLLPLGDRQVYAVLQAPSVILDPGRSVETTFLFYFGPLSEKNLKGYYPGLEAIVDYGTFDFLGRAVVVLLHWIHGYTANYGVCLILLAFVLRVLLFPVTQYNLRSLREMPRILDSIYSIEEEEKDPDRAAELTRPLRKKQIRAMAGSFLPLAIQIPLFLALYEALNRSIDLRRAGFIFWVKDLSVRDPYFLLPLLMGLAMILQQRLTSANPGEDHTWLYMPLGFALLFSFFPAGLVLFWLVDSLFSVVQLAWISTSKRVMR
ncbi:MAG: membrane protein insertase YidC [Deltaproteobacteria bacterium]|nr:membrane protein insertase YidC [Deltaproteobacteria bacterium]